MTPFATVQRALSNPLRNITHFGAIAVFLLLISFLVVLSTFWGHLSSGGHTWNSADWLINSEVVNVRRGLFGSVVLWISDGFRISPLVTVIALQSSLAGIVTAGAVRAVVLSPHGCLKALLFISPGFCLLFWAADPAGAARKELITYAAMSLLLFTNGHTRRDRMVVTGASLLFAFGVSGHIANAMMTPMFLFMAWLALGRRPPIWIAGAGVMCVWAAFNTWYAIRFSGISSAMDVCRPLLERGLDESLCADAIRVTAANTSEAIDFVANGAIGNGDGYWHIIIYPALLVPIVYLVRRTDGWSLLRWPIALSVLPLLPLYTVGFDWGRQTVMHITPIILMLALCLLRGRIVQVREVPQRIAWFMLFLALIWAPRHTFGIEWGMPLGTLLRVFGIV